MAKGETNMGSNGNGVSGIIVRGIGTFILGSAISLAAWTLYKISSLSEEVAAIRQNKEVEVLKSTVQKFHEAYYREQQKNERLEERQWAAIRQLKK